MRIYFEGTQYAYVVTDINTDIDLQNELVERQWDFDDHSNFIHHLDRILKAQISFEGAIGEGGNFFEAKILEFDWQEVASGITANDCTSTDEISYSRYFPSPWEIAVNEGMLICASVEADVIFYKYIEYSNQCFIAKIRINEDERLDASGKMRVFSNAKEFVAPFAHLEIIHSFQLRDKDRHFFFTAGHNF